MSKNKNLYACTDCGSEFPKWAGQCGECGAWNTLTEIIREAAPKGPRAGGYAGQVAKVTVLEDVKVDAESRVPSGLSELDRVLGGGLVAGSVVLIGGDPGIGKSTILLQTLTHLAEAMPALYVTGEESLGQVAMRARRLELPMGNLKLMAETCVENIIATAREQKPRVLVVDSIQTIFTEALQSAPGGVSQIRESAALLTRFAKHSGCALFLVGHVTKEGALAGPRVLEHMVDVVMSFEGERSHQYRILRALKNRFGAVDEIGVFAMAGAGLEEVGNPSLLFLSGREEPLAGSAVFPALEGTRPVLVEIQALIVRLQSGATPRRAVVGWDSGRLAMLLAVLESRCGLNFSSAEVYLNVAGGYRLSDPAADVAVAAALVSALADKPLPTHAVWFGEVSLAGEIRPVSHSGLRLREAAKLGFGIGHGPTEADANSSGLNYRGLSRLANLVDRVMATA